MARVSLTQPDVTLLLDMSGVIREATVSAVLSDESVNGWLGRSWPDTVADAVSDKVRRIVQDARESGISAFRQLTQRFPSGREVPIEYTTVMLGGRAGLLAVGKSLLAVAELQTQFVAAQQAIERDHWKLREVETRYKLLFNHSTEAVLLVRAGDLGIEEANPAARQALGLESARKDLFAAVPQEEQDALRAMLRHAREQGKPPAILVHLGEKRQPWMARASAVQGEPGTLLLVQLVPMSPRSTASVEDELPSAKSALSGLADGFVLLDESGVIRQANQAFAVLVDLATPAAVVGESLDKWIWRPGADVQVLLATLRSHKTVRLFPSSLHSELAVETEVEISGSAVMNGSVPFYGLIIRDVGRRLSRYRDPKQMNALIESVAEPVGSMPLKQLVRATVDGVERHYILAALEVVGGNRTAAAELLGLSRQSLYIKLGRYGLESETQTGSIIEK